MQTCKGWIKFRNRTSRIRAQVFLTRGRVGFSRKLFLAASPSWWLKHVMRCITNRRQIKYKSNKYTNGFKSQVFYVRIYTNYERLYLPMPIGGVWRVDKTTHCERGNVFSFSNRSNNLNRCCKFPQTKVCVLRSSSSKLMKYHRHNNIDANH